MNRALYAKNDLDKRVRQFEGDLDYHMAPEPEPARPPVSVAIVVLAAAIVAAAIFGAWVF